MALCGTILGSSPSNTTASSMENTMMVPFLHFSGGNFLFFKSLHPNSAATLAAASITLFFLAIIDRGLAAFRGLLEAYWSRSTPKLTSLDDAQPEEVSDHDHASIRSLLGASRKALPKYALRTVPPFILAHDILRGLLYALQTLLAYALMLAVMTFQAAYIISIIIGFGVGEVLFGRFAAAERHPSH